MASFSLPNHCSLSSLHPTQTRTTTSSPQNPQVFSKLSKSQFHGVKLSNSASLSFPSSSSMKSVVFAKVHCYYTGFVFVSYGLFYVLGMEDDFVYWLWLLIVSLLLKMKVKKGSVPPSFTLKDQDGKTVSLSKFKGKPVVVYFYPADETPGCTKQVLFFPLLSPLMLVLSKATIN